MLLFVKCLSAALWIFFFRICCLKLGTLHFDATMLFLISSVPCSCAFCDRNFRFLSLPLSWPICFEFYCLLKTALKRNCSFDSVFGFDRFKCVCQAYSSVSWGSFANCTRMRGLLFGIVEWLKSTLVCNLLALCLPASTTFSARCQMPTIFTGHLSG